LDFSATSAQTVEAGLTRWACACNVLLIDSHRVKYSVVSLFPGTIIPMNQSGLKPNLTPISVGIWRDCSPRPIAFGEIRHRARLQ